MKIKIYIIAAIWIVLLSIANVSAENSTNNSIIECYQEDPSVENQTGIDGNCGLDYSGEGWTTEDYFYENYTIPDNMVNASWLVKHGTLDRYNSTIPQSCISGDTLQVRLVSTAPQLATGPFTSYGQCYNSTGWENITLFEYQGIDPYDWSWTATSVTYINDGNWDTHVIHSYVGGDNFRGSCVEESPSNCKSSRLYEDAIWWKVEEVSIDSSSEDSTSEEVCELFSQFIYGIILFVPLIGIMLGIIMLLRYMNTYNTNKIDIRVVISGTIVVLFVVVMIILSALIVESFCSIL